MRALNELPRTVAAGMHTVFSDIDDTLTTDGQLVPQAYVALDTLRRAGKLCAELRFGQLDEILATGLHAFLTQFLDRVNDLGSQISRDFLVPLPQ